jgi:hypothetical protein
MTQMAAVSCADTQIPETTVATQSFPKVGFRKAIQLEVLVISIEAKCCFQQYHRPLSRSAGINLHAQSLCGGLIPRHFAICQNSRKVSAASSLRARPFSGKDAGRVGWDAREHRRSPLTTGSRALSSANPEVQIELVTGTTGALLEQVSRYAIEAAFVAERFESGDLEMMPVFRERPAVIAPKEITAIKKPGDFGV